MDYRIEPYYDGKTTAITQYQVKDAFTLIVWFIGTHEQCLDWIDEQRKREI